MLFRYPEETFARTLVRTNSEFGFPEFDLARPSGRFWSGDVPQLVLQGLDSARTEAIPSPAELLNASLSEPVQTLTRRSIARLFAWFLVLEDRQRRLDRNAVVALAHQASLVRHCLDEPNLRRVLIADEVGLGKTVEAGLIVKELLRETPGLRVLYLAPARLVRNVSREFERLELPFRVWSADASISTATLTDDRIIASIHRASHDNHRDRFLAAKKPWNVIIVDECHHLSDWKEGGGSPVQKYRLVESLIEERLAPDGRVILLSGTPHQGHAARFDNLLRFLHGPGDTAASLTGRVIYRTKADVHDWERRPLFPGRQVNRPIELNLTPEYRAWLTSIHAFFEPRSVDSGRAAGWRAGMALQWATSSVEAGLGFLVRQGIRGGLSFSARGVNEALAALRPYRAGPEDEPLSALWARMMKEIERQTHEDDLDDLDELDNEGRWRPDLPELSRLLEAGVALARSTGTIKWETLTKQVLEPADDEKFVLFAQPIETVTRVAGYLQREFGVRPSLIIGAQSEDAREMEIQRFRDDPRVRFLVSSRAGGEGLNLQVARRLVHLDVPWNPMELEQRVGRVHRFGSRRTIVVDTLVVAGSRETDAYRIAHSKLREIASTMVPADRFEELFARVMSLVPPEELQEVLAAGPLAPLSPDSADSVQRLVTEGFHRWQDFDQRYKSQQGQLKALDPGAATWDDVIEFVEREGGAERVEGFETARFRAEGREIVEDASPASVLRLGKELLALGETDGMPVRSPHHGAAQAVGLNSEPVLKLLRDAALPREPTGAAVLGWNEQAQRYFDTPQLLREFGVLAFGIQPLTSTRGYGEHGATRLMFYVVTATDCVQIEPDRKRGLLKALASAPTRRERRAGPLQARLQSVEHDLFQQLRRANASSASGERVLPVVTPLLAAIVTRD